MWVSNILQVTEIPRKVDILMGVQIDANGTKEENVNTMTKKLAESGLWQKVIVEGKQGAHFLV